MSDSESASSEPSPPSSRAVSPQPQTEQPEPEKTAGSEPDKPGNQRTPEPINTEIKPPVLESDGVHFSWPDPSSFVDEPGEDDSTVTSFDYVFVPGIYGSCEDGAEAGPDSPSSSWALDYVKAAGRNDRILKFEYAAQNLFSGAKCREAIRSCALQLLRGILALRRDAKRRRLIAFIAFDLGATLDLGTWSEIADMSRLLIFCGCPHRGTSSLNMEDRLCRFVFASSRKGSVSDALTPTASSVAGLAAATIEVNGLIISLHAGTPLGEEDTPTKTINQVFDSYGGTLGVPFEKRFVLTGSEASDITNYLNELNAVLAAKYTDDAMLYERKLLSVASPVDPFRSAKDLNASVMQTSTYKTWLDLPGPQILYIHGSQGAREAAEQVFYNLDSRKYTEDTIVLYFSFDRWDVRRDSIRDMASTFMAQIICQLPRNEEWTERLFAQLDVEKGWTEADLIYWLERFRFNDQFEQAIYVINHFDDCTKGSRQAFLQRFKYLAANSEGHWKMVLTSHKPGALLGELSDTALTTLDLSTPENTADSNADAETDIKRLMHSRPELLLQEDLVRQELAEISRIDPLARRVVVEQAQAQSDWPDRLSVRSLIQPLRSANDASWDDATLASLLDRLLRSVSDKVPSIRLLLSWLLYTVRPPTIWELGAALYLSSSTDKDIAVPPPSAFNDLIRNIQIWLAGIVEIDQNEVRISHPRLRNILMGKLSLKDTEGDKSPQNAYIWDDIPETAHADIARQCLGYLSRPAVQELVDRAGSTAGTSVHVFADRGNLCSYALQAWTYHFLKASPADQAKLAIHFESSSQGRSWAQGYWALSNPVTRSKKPLNSLYPIFTGLGLCNTTQPRDAEDLACGVMEAASKGQTRIVKRLIRHNELTEATLLDVLDAAGASGDEQLILDLIQQISSKSSKPEAIVWSTPLLFRAAWLGLHRVIERLLQLGIPTDPENPLRGDLKSTPLYRAVRNSHVAAVRVLLSHGTDLSFRSGPGRTPLHLAAELGNAEIAGLLHDPLYFACLYGHYAAVEELLRRGADPNMGLTAENPNGKWTPLISAAEGGFNKCTKLLIDNKVEVDLDGPTVGGTALRHAVIKGRTESCRLLLEGGANPNSPLIKTPLIVQLAGAVGPDRQETRMQILKLLLENGVDVNAKDESSQATIVSLLDWDDIGPFYEVILNHPGVDVNITDADNSTPLHFATLKKHPTAVPLLLAHGAEVNRVSNDGITPLYHATPKADLVGALLEAGANPSVSNFSGYTGLMFAAWFESNEESLKLLLKHNAALEAEFSGEGDYAGWTALTCAIARGYTAAVRHLVEAGANIQHVGADGLPMLHHAVNADIDPVGKLAVLLEFFTRLDLNQTDKRDRTALHLVSMPAENMKRLINAGAEVNKLDNESQTPLNSGVVSIDKVKLLVDAGSNPDVQDSMGRTALTEYVANGNIETVQFLLKHGADPNILSRALGGPLHRSARNSNLEMVKFLLENDDAVVDVNAAAPSVCGTPLISAIMRWDTEDNNTAEIIKLLVKRGADVNVKGGLLGYPLNAAAFNSEPEMIDLLIENGADKDAKDDFGRAPVHLAAIHGLDAFKKVVDVGCDVAVSDITGRTVLMWAAQPGRLETVKKILDMMPDADVDSKDQDGWTALCWAARGPKAYWTDATTGDLAQVIKLLLARGADKRVVGTGPDGKGWTPLKIARYHGALPEVVELLRGEGEADPEDETKASAHSQVGTTTYSCDVCYSGIFGFRYNCKSCDWFDLCFKCYPHREKLHVPRDHEFNQVGSEFVEEEVKEEEGGDGEKADDGTSTTTSSDDDSDDDEEEKAKSEKSEESGESS
ncbi:ankyrin repeat-containing domain protein [Cercophora newfieldiana]|uniref:Ankyrin repeat-containing domain protein n=1 Tax=Cercophora newfieldiana TaxID=92897 RepID=A0AA39YM36_9PEZI|nr:ankyrin repeat-containing domain protein [Cercophora newfieldiana]